MRKTEVYSMIYLKRYEGVALALWLVRSTLERAVWVRPLAGVLGEDSLLSQCLSPPSVHMGTDESNAKVNSAMTSRFMLQRLG